MINVTAVGELLIDFACIGTDNQGFPTLAAHPGGAPANFLAAINRFGGETALLSKVGDDIFGKMLIGTLKKSGINTNGIVCTKDVFTTLAFVTLDEAGNREFTFSRKPGADTRLEFEELNLSLIDNATAFHFGTLSLTDEPARKATYKSVEYAKTKNKLISFDPNLRKPLWDSLSEAKQQILWGLSKADVVKISNDEISFLFNLQPESGANLILEKYNVKLVFVTCGEKGCFYANRNTHGFVPALSNIIVKDTTGAGDIFGGSALWKILKIGKSPDLLTYHELEDIAQFATKVAGLSTTKLGGISSIPTIEEINAYRW